MVWAHSVSRHLVNWKSLQHAIYSFKPFDMFGCWSRSATVVSGKGPEVQCYAEPEDPNDPLLREWIKPDRLNPIAVADKDMNRTAFRDPTTASKDFMTWVRAKHPIHSKSETGMWECPDFYSVSVKGSVVGNHQVKHVLKNSLDDARFEYYTLGTYLEGKDRYVADKRLIDGWAGIQAIPRTVWLDSRGRQLVQWPIEELNRLRAEEVKMKNQKLEKGGYVEVKGITAAQADVEVTFTFSSLDKAETYDPKPVKAGDLCQRKGSNLQGGVGPFGLLTLASQNLEEFTPVFFRIFRGSNKYVVLLCSNARSHLYKPSFAGFVHVDLATDMKLSIRSLIDHSVVEILEPEGRQTFCLGFIHNLQ
ncbi:hypothetical protein VNO78_12178 [Psophocarpus tetragonolobus]|uniref:Uncharacterized protein n=1 Tax=Psophocarpus tetragonolobus TaxID=3891 RepID=A0AAN9XPB0_PSOTE